LRTKVQIKTCITLLKYAILRLQACKFGSKFSYYLIIFYPTFISQIEIDIEPTDKVSNS
jgi:hypothetical protein